MARSFSEYGPLVTNKVLSGHRLQIYSRAVQICGIAPCSHGESQVLVPRGDPPMLRSRACPIRPFAFVAHGGRSAQPPQKDCTP